MTMEVHNYLQVSLLSHPYHESNHLSISTISDTHLNLLAYLVVKYLLPLVKLEQNMLDQKVIHFESHYCTYSLNAHTQKLHFVEGSHSMENNGLPLKCSNKESEVSPQIQRLECIDHYHNWAIFWPLHQSLLDIDWVFEGSCNVKMKDELESHLIL